MRRKSILVFILGVILILSGLITLFIQNLTKDVENSKENEETIETTYQIFKDLMESFNNERELLYENVINNLYVEDVVEKYWTWTENYENYEKIVSKVTEYKDVLAQRCLNSNYTDSNLQSKCDSMVISYETAINYYVKDINKFNSFLQTYNNQVEELDRVNMYDLKEYNFIDFNDDGKYLGE